MPRLRELFRHESKEVLLAGGAPVMWIAFFYIGAVYLTNYGTSVLGIDRNTMLLINLLGVGFDIVGSILGALLADKLGRRAVMAAANGLAVIWAFVMFPLANSGSQFLMGIAVCVTLLLVGIACSLTAALVPEVFRTRYRSTGAGVSFNVGSVIGGAIPPIIAAPILATSGSIGLSIMMAVVAAVAVISVILLRENQRPVT